LQLVVIQIATETDRREHQHLPVVEAFATAIGAGILVDVLGDQLQDAVPYFGARINVLQRLENGNQFVTTLQIEFHLTDAWTIQPLLL